MRWKTKSRLQNGIARLPSTLSLATYYWIQRHLGALKNFRPTSRFEAAIKTWKFLLELGYEPTNKKFLEVGTGRVPAAPLAYWLMGAERTTTIDLNPYVRSELIVDSLDYIVANRQTVAAMFGPLLDTSRLEALLHFHRRGSFSISAFLELSQIDYIAPGDAANTSLADNSIDFHTSYNVLEHIPYTVLAAILKEGNRLVDAEGLFVHRIDYSDHFSHTDNEICAINFLQFPQAEWDRLAGNRYMYMNRLRHDDFLTLFSDAAHEIVLARTEIDERSLDMLRQGNIEVDQQFKTKSETILATSGSWVASRCIVRKATLPDQTVQASRSS